MSDERSVVVRRVIDPEDIKPIEEKPRIIAASTIAIISHLNDSFLVVPVDEYISIDGDNVRENGVDAETAKGIAVNMLALRERLGEAAFQEYLPIFSELWDKAMELVKVGSKVLLFFVNNKVIMK
jgi:hypothetical protein